MLEKSHISSGAQVTSRTPRPPWVRKGRGDVERERERLVTRVSKVYSNKIYLRRNNYPMSSS
jgi:hypothetical protein